MVKVGDLIAAIISHELVEAVIVSDLHPGPETFWVRRLGKTLWGTAFPLVARHVSEILTLASDAGTANVFADWLEEEGEMSAATKLRERYPMI